MRFAPSDKVLPQSPKRTLEATTRKPFKDPEIGVFETQGISTFAKESAIATGVFIQRDDDRFQGSEPVLPYLGDNHNIF